MLLPGELLAVFLALTLWVAPVAIIAWLVVRATGGARPAPPLRAVQLLEERYARGELGREEFLQAKQDLI